MAAYEIRFSEKELKIPLKSIPNGADFLVVNSFLDYVILHSLGRTLISRNSNGEYEGDLAKSWRVSPDQKIFDFQIEDEEKFSDGTVIGIDDVVFSFERIAASKKPLIHFSNPGLIQKVIKLDKSRFRVELMNSDFDFISRLVHPEFSIVPKGYLPSKKFMGDLIKTSGAYSVSASSEKSMTLLSNPHFKKNSNRPNRVTFQPYGDKPQLQSLLLSQKVNYFIPSEQLTNKEHRELVAKGWQGRDTLLGFSYFLALNPNSINLKKKEHRLYLLDLISKTEFDFEEYKPFLKRANQIYLEHGPGRLRANDLKSIENERIKTMVPIDKSTSLSLLIDSRFEFLGQLVGSFEGAGLKIQVTKYSNFKEYADLIKKKEYDLIQANNDFSALDLLENLRVTFNLERPLISAEQNAKIFDLLRQAGQVENGKVRYDLIKEIGEQILKNAYAAPIYHVSKYDYALENIDRSKLSTSEPEFRIWKILVK
jgi:ABC-type transport system substrate-binding protein